MKRIIILLILSFVLVSGCTNCPSDCNDADICTNDYCSEATNFECVHDDIIPCVGNGICENDEYPSSDCPNCNDNNQCTADSINFNNQECINEPITPCCGNGIKEEGETCSSCIQDIKCVDEKICCNNKCISPSCLSDNDCDDQKDYTTDTCLKSGKCGAECSHETTNECKADGYCPESCDYANDEDCLSEGLEKTKYTIDDIETVKELAKEYKFDTSELTNEYEAGEVLVQVTDYTTFMVTGKTDDVTEEDKPIKVYILTPFYEAVKTFAGYEQEYKKYSDSDIINVLSKDYIHVAVIWWVEVGFTGGTSNFNDLGEFKTIALKTDEDTISSTSPDYNWADPKIKGRKIEKFSSFYNKDIQIILVGESGEKELAVDLGEFR